MPVTDEDRLPIILAYDMTLKSLIKITFLVPNYAKASICCR